MENYINNIIDDMRDFMKANPEATPDAAWHHAIDYGWADGVIESRKNLRDAEKFVLKALEDDELQREARNVTTALYNNWRELDAMLYLIVCLVKHDEIIARVKKLAE